MKAEYNPITISLDVPDLAFSDCSRPAGFHRRRRNAADFSALSLHLLSATGPKLSVFPMLCKAWGMPPFFVSWKTELNLWPVYLFSTADGLSLTHLLRGLGSRTVRNTRCSVMRQGKH